jgi:ankyrin repeat protein
MPTESQPMKSSRKKLIGLAILLLLLVTLGIAASTVYREVRQPDLNRALIAAVKKNDTSKANALLSEGADPDPKDIPPDKRSMWLRLWDRIRGKPLQPANEPTALLVATRMDCENRLKFANDPNRSAPDLGPLIKALLNAGATVNVAGSDGRTPLIWTVMKPNYEIASLLISKGANVNACDYSGSMALHYAADNKNPDLVRLLLARGALVNAKNTEGTTPLKRAAMYGRTDIVRLLIADGAEVDARDGLGRTPFAWAAHMGQADCVELLLASGAHIGSKDKKGMSAQDIARQDQNDQMVALLKKAGAKE